MDKVFTAIEDKIAELEGEIRALETIVTGINYSKHNKDNDLKEAKRKRQLLKDVLSILRGNHIFV